MDTVVDAVAGTGVDTATTVVNTADVALTKMAFATVAVASKFRRSLIVSVDGRTCDVRTGRCTFIQ